MNNTHWSQMMLPRERIQQLEVINNELRRELTAAKSEIERLRGLVEIALCPCCDGSGAYYDNHGEVCQCQWCDERAQRVGYEAEAAEKGGDDESA